MPKDAALRAALQVAEDASRALHDTCPQPVRAPANFSSAVLDEIRCLPSRDELVKITATEVEHAAKVESVVTYGRRLLVAAVVLFGLNLLFCFNLLRDDEGEDLAADDQKIMKQLDEKAKKLLRNRLRPK